MKLRFSIEQILILDVDPCLSSGIGKMTLLRPHPLQTIIF